MKLIVVQISSPHLMLNGNNQGLLYFTAMNNQFLNCIDVDDVAWANSNWSKDTWATFSTNCSVSNVEKITQLSIDY